MMSENNIVNQESLNAALSKYFAMKRIPILAAVFSFFDAGLGHIYNGNIKKGILFYFSFQFILFLAILTNTFKTFYGLLFSLATILGFRIFLIVHSFFEAKKILEFKPRYFNRWFFYPAFMVLSVMFYFSVSKLISPLNKMSAHVIAASSMEPVLLKNDYIMADENYFNKNSVGRNDIIIYHPNKNSKNAILGRIIAIAGDTISSKDFQIYLNNQPLDESYLLPYNYSEADYLNPTLREFEEVIIELNSIFILSDNRMNSIDSRMFGQVSVDNILSKPLYIYWSEKFNRIGTAF